MLHFRCVSGNLNDYQDELVDEDESVCLIKRKSMIFLNDDGWTTSLAKGRQKGTLER